MKPLKANFILGKKQIILASLVVILGAAVYLNWQFANSNNDLDLTTALDPKQIVQENKDIVNPEDAVINETDAKADPKKDAKVDVKLDTKAGAKADVKIDTKSTPKATDKKVEVKPTQTKTTAKPKDTKTEVKPTDAKATEKALTKGKNLGDTLLVSSKSIADETYFVMAKLARTKSRDAAIETISTVLNDTKLTDDDKKEVSAKAVAITDIIEAESRIENLIKAKGFEECVVYITEKNASVVVKTDGLDQDRATQIKNIIVSEGKIKGENISITEIN